MIEKVELLVCDDCNCISTGNPEENVPCMECGKTMARVEFVRQLTHAAPDAACTCRKNEYGEITKYHRNCPVHDTAAPVS